MNTLSANEAKIHFGDLLLKAQQAPIQINKPDLLRSSCELENGSIEKQ